METGLSYQESKEKTSAQWMQAAINALRLELDGSIVDDVQKRWNAALEYLQKPIWVDAKEKPEENIGVLVFIPEEDNHITSGMWDVSKKWVLLDEYRVPECEVTHWMKLPKEPEGFERIQLQPEIISELKKMAKKELPKLKAQFQGNHANEEDATVAMLDEIISWEKDLSEYKSLETILRSKYKITKR